MSIPCVHVLIDVRWLHQFLETHFGRTVAACVVTEVRREATTVLESSLIAGQSISLGAAIAEALDMLGYMQIVTGDETEVL